MASTFANTRYEKRPFNDDNYEKAYMLSFIEEALLTFRDLNLNTPPTIWFGEPLDGVVTLPVGPGKKAD